MNYIIMYICMCDFHYVLYVLYVFSGDKDVFAHLWILLRGQSCEYQVVVVGWREWAIHTMPNNTIYSPPKSGQKI